MLDIESILDSLGITVTRVEGSESWALCPLHYQRTGRMDHKPSWSINVESTAHHCFSCGYGGNIVTLYRDLTGSVPDDLDWQLVKQGVVSADLEGAVSKPQVEGPKVSEWTLAQYVDVPERLLRQRHLERASVDRYGVRWDPVGKCWVIPIRSLTGDLMGYQFRQKGQVINHPAGMEKSKTLFGIHRFREESRIVVVESPLDAVRFANLDVPAVSSFGAFASAEQIDLLAKHFRYVLIAMDNDSAGIKASFYLRKALERRGCVALEFDYTGLAAKDPGDIESDEELRNAWRSSNSLRMVP